MKKKYLSIFLSVLLMGGFTSCNDWLDIEQNTEKDAEEMFDNYDGFKGALSGCYSNLAKTDLYGTRMTMSNVESLASLWYLENTPQSYSTEIMTNYYLRVHDYSQTSAQDVIETIYSNLYNAVLETNMIIKAFADGKGAVIPDATTRAIIEGEAYGLRALLQLDILRLFGQIPNGATVQVSLPYSEVTAYNDELTYYPFDKYVEKLKSDIEQAKTLLKDNDPVCEYSILSLNTSSLSGEIPLDDDFLYYRQYRLNYWAVRALEARMYMYLGDKTKAHDIALEVINATTTNGDKVIELSSNTDYGQAAANLAYNSPSECLFSLYFYNLHDISYPLLFGVPTAEGETDSRGVNPQYNLSAMMGESFTLKAPLLEATSTMNIIGMTVQWLLLEGHCYGSSMIYVPQENALFSGDVLFAGSIGRYDFPTSSHLTTKESLEKIKSLQFDARLLPGHGEESSLNYEQKHNPFLRS